MEKPNPFKRAIRLLVLGAMAIGLSALLVGATLMGGGQAGGGSVWGTALIGVLALAEGWLWLAVTIRLTSRSARIPSFFDNRGFRKPLLFLAGVYFLSRVWLQVSTLGYHYFPDLFSVRGDSPWFFFDWYGLFVSPLIHFYMCLFFLCLRRFAVGCGYRWLSGSTLAYCLLAPVVDWAAPTFLTLRRVEIWRGGVPGGLSDTIRTLDTVVQFAGYATAVAYWLLLILYWWRAHRLDRSLSVEAHVFK